MKPLALVKRTATLERAVLPKQGMKLTKAGQIGASQRIPYSLSAPTTNPSGCGSTSSRLANGGLR
jgi:hypothetical protein